MKKVDNWLIGVMLAIAIVWAVYFAFVDRRDSIRVQELLQELVVHSEKLAAMQAELEQADPNNQSSLRTDAIEWWRKYNDDRRRIEAELESLQIFRLYSWSYIFPLILGVLAFFGINKIISNVATERLQKITDGQLENIKRVFESETWSVDLRDRYRILVITANQLSPSVEKVLNIKDNKGKPQFNWTYGKISEENFHSDSIRELMGNEYQLVFIDADGYEIKGTTPKGDVQRWANSEDFAKKLSEVGNAVSSEHGRAVFYFSTVTPSPRFPALERNNFLTAFANTESQIYPNLMNLMKLYNKLGGD